MSDIPADSWLSPRDAAPLLGVDERTVRRWANDGKFVIRRSESDRRAPILILLSSLPDSAQQKWKADQPGSAVAICTTQIVRPALLSPAPAPTESGEGYRMAWAWYEKQGSKAKRQAEFALAVMDDYCLARDAGVSVGMAAAAIRAKHHISDETLWRHRSKVERHPRQHWLPLLAPRYCGNGKEAEFTEEAWDWILARHLTQSQTKISTLVRLAREEGAGKGWKIPSVKTVGRRLARVSSPLDILGRQGPKALEASFPTVEKDWASTPLHEMWESDGCRLNLNARWPDGTTGRPFIVTWRECRTRIVLSCKGYKNPCGELVMASLREAIENCGFKPKRAKLDNGREYANKAFSGQQKTRYRFKVMPGEPVGVATQMGIKIEWSPPGRGRDKAIESWHNLLHQNVEQRPEFAGAYCGKDALSRPEECDKDRAVPIELVNKALGEFLHWYNTKHQHRGHGMNRRTPQAVYGELLPTVSKENHRPDPAHLRLLLMAVKTLTPSKDDATFKLKLDGYGERRYWSEEFWGMPMPARLKSYAVWYHPENPDAPIAIYDGEIHVCECNPKDRLPAVGAGDAAAAHVKQKNSTLAPVKAELKAIKAASQMKLPSFADNNVALIGVSREEPRQQEPEAVLQPTGTSGEPVCRIERPLFPEREERSPNAEIEAMRRRQLEKTLPAYLRDCA